MTRPTDASLRFWNALPSETRRALELVVSPLMKIEPVSFEAAISEYEAVIFSSRNGVEAVSSKTSFRGPAYCIGERTTEFANKSGWHARCMGRTAVELVEKITDLPDSGALLHLHGRHTRGDIAEDLKRFGRACDASVVYEQSLQPLTESVQQSLRAGKRHIVPLFSPRTAQHFAYECSTTHNIFFVAMSEAVAEPLKSLDYMELQISRAPDATSMADVVRDAAGRLA